MSNKREKFKRAKGAPTFDVPMPELGEGEFVRVRKLTARNLLDIRNNHGGEPELGDMRFAYDVFAKTVVDEETGELLFADAMDVGEWMGLSLGACKVLLQAILDHGGVGSGEKN